MYLLPIPVKRIVFCVAKAHDLSLRMAAMTMEAKKTPPNQLEIPELEAP
jgi:hypothetical protein